MEAFDLMESWIKYQHNLGYLKLNDSMMLDIGAYHGTFSEQFLKDNLIAKSMLFEANIINYNTLLRKFTNQNAIDIIHCALGSSQGEVQFHCDTDLSTGSVLPYEFKSNTSPEITHSYVKMIDLDTYLANHLIDKPISLIKIDTQGNDLNVLKGALNTILKHQPWLVVELIYLPLYQNQNNADEIISWLAMNDYLMIATFNLSYSKQGWLAFADGIFVPKNLLPFYQLPFYGTPLKADLIAENNYLKSVCAERLQLINHLHEQSTALLKSNEERLELINRLHKEAEELRN